MSLTMSFVEWGSPRAFGALRRDREQRKVRGWREHHPYGDFDPDFDFDFDF